jgi:Fe-S oxidoreductase
MQGAVHDKLLSIFQKAGYEVIIPKELGKLCCGMLFNTRGFTAAAAMKTEEVCSISCFMCLPRDVLHSMFQP